MYRLHLEGTLGASGAPVALPGRSGCEHHVPGLDDGVRRRTDRQGKRLIHQAIASPPGTKRASYRTSTSTLPDEWLKDSTDHPGSWWENWHDWIEKRAPASKPAAKALVGSDTYPPLPAAPGDYVRRRLT